MRVSAGTAAAVAAALAVPPAALLGATSAGVLQAITLDPSLALNGTTLAVVDSALSDLPAVSTVVDADVLPLSHGSDTGFGHTATAATLAAYFATKAGAATTSGTTAVSGISDGNVFVLAPSAGSTLTYSVTAALLASYVASKSATPSTATLSAESAVADGDTFMVAPSGSTAFSTSLTAAVLANYVASRINAGSTGGATAATSVSDSNVLVLAASAGGALSYTVTAAVLASYVAGKVGAPTSAGLTAASALSDSNVFALAPSAGAALSSSVTAAILATYVAGKIGAATTNGLAAESAVADGDTFMVAPSGSSTFSASATAYALASYVGGKVGSGVTGTNAITAGAASVATGGTESFTFTLASNVSSPFAGWVANGATSVGSTPALVGSAVALSSSSGSIVAPGTAAAYQLALLGSATGPVLALSGAVNATFSVSAATPYNQTFASNATLGQQMVTSGYVTIPASYFPTGGAPGFMILTLVAGTNGSTANCICTSSVTVGYSNHFQVFGYTPGDNATNYGGYLNGGTDIETLAIGRTATSPASPIVVFANGVGQLQDSNEPFADLTGVMVVGAYANGAQGITDNGGSWARFGIFNGDMMDSGFVFPVWPYVNDSRHIASWSFDGTNAGA